jgi:hypothetical protein
MVTNATEFAQLLTFVALVTIDLSTGPKHAKNGT